MLAAGAGWSQAKIITSNALSVHETPKYPPGFKHWDYVNPNAPKGGMLRLAVVGSYDNFNAYATPAVWPPVYRFLVGGSVPLDPAPEVAPVELAGAVELLLRDVLEADLDAVIPDKSSAYRRLDVSILHHLIIDRLLGIDMDGGFGQYVAVPAHRLFALPESVPITGIISISANPPGDSTSPASVAV